MDSKIVKKCLAGAAAVLILVWNEALIAAPVVAVDRWTSPWVAFASMTVAYTAAGFLLSMLVNRAYSKFSSGTSSRFESWIEGQMSTKRGAVGRKAFGTGQAVGFLGSSILLGGPLTTWLARIVGTKCNIKVLALSSSFIFAIVFVALYTGIAVAIFA